MCVCVGVCVCLRVSRGDWLWGYERARVCACVSEAELVENINSLLAAPQRFSLRREE